MKHWLLALTLLIPSTAHAAGCGEQYVDGKGDCVAGLIADSGGTTTGEYVTLAGAGGITTSRSNDTITLTGTPPSIGGSITSGTPGSALFVGGTTSAPTLAQDNQNLYWDDTNNRLSAFSTLGSELVTNGNFTSNASSWSVPSGMAWSSGSVSKTSNGTGALTQAISPSKITSEYLLTYAISNWTVGTITPSYGGRTGTAVSANGTYTERFVATSSTSSLSFTPSNTARFTIDTISLKLLKGTNTASNISTGGLNVQGEWSNGSPGTTRSMTFNNDGSYTWTDYRFAGTLRGSYGVNSSGGHDMYASGGNYFAYYYGNSGLTSNSLFSYNYPTAFVHYGGGWFASSVHAGSSSTPTSTLQSAGGLALKVKRVTTSQSLDNTATHWLCDASVAVCTGTPSAACSSWSNQTDCEKWDAHGGCAWYAGTSCSIYDNESGMSSCSGQAGCTVVTASCSGAGDQTACEGQDDAYGGSCTWDGTDCSGLDEGTCSSYSGSGCSTNYSDCSSFNDDYSTCTATSGCSSSSSTDCSAYDGTDQGTCEANTGCYWDGMSNCYMTCSGTYYTGCSGTYYACNGNYNTGSCTGTYGAACTGTSTCSGIDDSTNCGLETGCTWSTAINMTLPSISSYPDRTYWIYNDSSTSADVNILPSGTDTVNGTTSLVLSTYKDGAHLSPLRETASCSGFGSAGACTPTGCSIVYCTWNGSECSGSNAACAALNPTDQGTCEATFDYCSGTYVVSSNWYIWSRT